MSYATLACLGPEALTFLQGQLTCDMTQVQADKLSLGCYCNAQGRVIALIYLHAVPEGFHLIVPADIAEILIKKLSKVIVFSKATLKDLTDKVPLHPELQASTLPIGSSAWRAHLIQSKMPYIEASNSEKFLPHDLGLVDLGAVSFNKGCYLGQEILSRMQYKAKLKKHLEAWAGTGLCPLEGEIVNQVEHEGVTYVLAIVI